MDNKPFEEVFRLIELLEKGGQLSDPTINGKVEKAIRGDPANLYEYLKSHPEIIDRARTKIFIGKRLTEENPFFPPPCMPEEVARLSGALQLGYFNPRKDVFGINPEILNLNVLVAGRAGSGKSNLNLIALDQLLEQAADFNIIIIDLKKEYRCLLRRHDNLKIITFKNLRFNPLEVPEWQDPKDHINNVAEVFCRENYILAFGKNMFISTVDYLYRERGVYAGSKNYPTFKDLYNVLSAGKGYGRQADSKASLLSRLQPYTNYPEIFCCQSFPFNTWLDNHLSIELENITNEMYSTITNHIVSLLYNYYHKKNLRGTRIRTLFVVDEAGVLFNAMRDKNVQFGDSCINGFVRKGREFGLGYWVTSQEPNTLSQAIHSNSFLKFMFPVMESRQLKIMASSMALNDQQLLYAFKLPISGTCIVRYSFFPNPLLLDVPLFTDDKVISDEYVCERMKDFYNRVMPPQDNTESEVPDRGDDQKIPEDAATLLKHIAENPFDNFTTHRETCSIGKHKVSKARQWLEENDYIVVDSIKTTRGQCRPSAYLVLQEKAWNYLKTKPRLGKGSFRHQIYCHIIKQKLERQGWKVKVESSVNLSKKLIDVVAQRNQEIVGYEITLHFENLKQNIEKDLKLLSKLVIVVEKKDAAKANKSLKQYDSSIGENKVVEIKAIDDFF